MTTNNEGEVSFKDALKDFSDKLKQSENKKAVAMGYAIENWYTSAEELQRLNKKCGAPHLGLDYVKTLESLRQALLDHAFDTGELISCLKG